MTRYERYREQLAKLEEKRSSLMRSGRFVDSFALNEDIKEVERAIAQAEEYERLKSPQPIKEVLSEEELHEMGIIPLIIECHLVADFLTEVSYMVVDICKNHGLSDISLMPDLKEIIKKTDKFASFLTGVSPELSDLLVRNETFNTSLHKKYVKYIEQRLK